MAKNPMAQAEGYPEASAPPDNRQQQQGMAASDGPKSVGCRPCSWLISFRYILMLAGIILGIVVIFATPRQCPSGYEEQTCVANGHNYDCRNGLNCSNKEPSPGARAGGIIIIIISSIIGCIQCCHQSRCILSDDHYNNKICFCC